MKSVIYPCLLALATLVIALPEAEAGRIGGGRSVGMQRSQSPAMQRQIPPSTAAAPASSPMAQQAATQTKRSWAGPLAGLAAGLGLGMLMSHLGVGGSFMGLLLLIALAFGAVMLFRAFTRRQQGGEPSRYAHGALATSPQQPLERTAPTALSRTPTIGSALGAAGSAAAPLSHAIQPPAGFDADRFLRSAKVHFVRLQTANDAANLDDLREFTSPEVYAEIKLDIDARNGKAQHTEVEGLDAELIDVVEESGRTIASVLFTGRIRENNLASALKEIWHFAKPSDGSSGWVVAGIQQPESSSVFH